MRILFIGIFDTNEPNTAFRNALKNVATSYCEIAHNACSKIELQQKLISFVKLSRWKPELVFMQLQGANIINDEALAALKATGAFLCQWTGDARQPLPKHYIDFGKKINLSLFTNQDDVDVMLEHGAVAAYLQVSADHNIYTPNGTRIDGVPEIVFMGNNYDKTFTLSNYRLEMCKYLKETFGDRFGVYGANYPSGMATGNVMYQQMKEAEIYRSCKIAINCSHYDLKKYTSDRFFRILLSGAFCISKEFPQMEEYSPGENFVPVSAAFHELRDAINYYLRNEEERNKIARNGYEYAYTQCQWSERIKELLNIIKTWNG